MWSQTRVAAVVVAVVVVVVVSLLQSPGCLAVDLNYTEIIVVSNETRFTTRHPDARLVAFTKERHVKGKFVFSAGERIGGDRLVLNFLDQIQFTKAEDIEVILGYPARNESSVILTFVQIFVDLSSPRADSYFFGGGIDDTFADMLLVCNQTQHYTYEIFMYGY